jgi:hypothetical protein
VQHSQRLAGCLLAISFRCGGPCLLGVQPGHGMQRRVIALNLRQVRLDHLHRGQLALADQGRELGR